MRKFISNNRYTSVALLIIASAFLYNVAPVLMSWNATSWDAFGYYYYLRLAFIDHSMVIHSLDSIKPVFDQNEPSSTLYQFTRMDDGRWIIRYPVGQALLYLPFFIGAHITALLSKFPADAFSRPYQFAMFLGGMIYHFLGLVFTAKILRRRYKDAVVAVTLVLLFFGTNAYYSIVGGSMSAQGSLFFLIALFIWLVDCYFRKKSTKFILAGGFVFGLICLSRPTDFLTIIPALLWPLTIPGMSLKDELLALLHRKKHLIAFLVPVVLCAMVQFSYWKYAGGSWFIDSYGSPAEGLDFLNPHTIPFLFSFKSGWFLYTPLMLLVMIYLIVRAYKKDKTMIAVLIYAILFIYISSTWTNWWYGGGFSQRAMVQAYVLLSLPLAGLVEYTFFQRRKFHVLIGFLISVFFVLSIWQTIQFKNHVLTGETITPKYYLASFLDLHPNPKHLPLLAFDQYDWVINSNHELPDGYILSQSRTLDVDAAESNLDGREFFTAFSMRYKDLTDKEYCFIKFTAVFDGTPPKDASLVVTFDHKGNYGYSRELIDSILDSAVVNNQYSASLIYLTPYLRTTSDKFTAYIWNSEKSAGKIIRFKLDVYENPESD